MSVLRIKRALTGFLRGKLQTAEDLAGVAQMKKDFISNVSHELKAPLASMQETTHLLLERIPGPLTEKQERLLQLNLQSGKRLAAMIGNLLDLSRLEAGIVDYEMQVQDVTELAQSVIFEAAPQANEKMLRIITDISEQPLMVMCDPKRVVQILTNLIDNAVRFSIKGGFVSVHLSALKSVPDGAPRSISSPEGFVLVAISDTGPGIEDAHKDGVFQTFHQMRLGKKVPGQSIGLGLAITRVLVEAHGGAIWVEDNSNGGSVFFVLLPRAAAEPSSLSRAS